MSTYLKGTTVRMKRKITVLNSQLIKDVIAKIDNLRNLREMNYRATAYQVGEILCTVRNLLGKIVQLYTQVEPNEMSDDEVIYILSLLKNNTTRNSTKTACVT